MMRIQPGDPGRSYLAHKLLGTQAEVGGSGEQMPPGAPLDPDTISLIENWIRQLPADGIEARDKDNDGSLADQDCNDGNAEIRPSATEVTGNSIDENCDDILTDRDGDGADSEVNGGLDRDDLDATVYPGAMELCSDGKDNDQNGLIDEHCQLNVDGDGDGVTPYQGDCNDNDPTISPSASELPGNSVDENCDRVAEDKDGDGHLAVTDGGGDVIDLDASVYPGAPEICGDGRDNNLSGEADEGCAEAQDIDQDGITLAQGDCNDNDSSIYPGAIEISGNGVDEDCDGHIADADGDTYDTIGGGPLDCNDADASIHPSASELGGNLVDENCDGTAGDIDADGFDSQGSPFRDCNDTDAAIYPTATDVPDDGIDQDCNGRDSTNFTFSRLQAEVFNVSCTLSQCHDATSPPFGLDLSAGDSYGRLVGVTSSQNPGMLRIKPGDPSGSYLYLKLTGDASIIGVRMPAGTPALSPEQLIQISNWIQYRARDN